VFTTNLVIVLNVTFFVVLVNPTISCREIILKCVWFYYARGRKHLQFYYNHLLGVAIKPKLNVDLPGLEIIVLYSTKKIELLTHFRKYNKTIPKMKWCFFQVCYSSDIIEGKEKKIFVPWSFCNVSWIRAVFIASLWLYLVKYNFSAHVFKLSFLSKEIKIVTWDTLALCALCVLLPIFLEHLINLLTLWPIFVKLDMSVTTVEDTWSQNFWFPTAVLTIWRNQVLAVQERRVVCGEIRGIIVAICNVIFF